MSATLLFLPAAADDPWLWARVSDDSVVTRGEGVPEGDDSPVIAVAPADAVTLHWAELPDRSAAQAVAAARILVSDASAVPVGELHVAVGDEATPDRPIGVVANDRMHAWLAMLAAQAIDPAAIIPAPMLLPRPDEGYLRADLGGRAVVRGATSGFADEARLTELITGGATPETMGREALEAALVATVASPALDLRQGAFARRKRRAVDWRLVRRLALLSASILLATLAIDLVRIAKYSVGASTLEARADTVARTGLPRGADQGDSARLLAERLSRLRGPGEGFSRTAAAVTAAVRSSAGTELTALTFEPTGEFRATVAAEGEAQVNALVARLRETGFEVQPSTFEASGGRVSGQIVVSAP